MKKTKRFFVIALSLIMMLSFSINVCAQENIPNNSDILIEQGFTNDGIHYDVYKTQDEDKVSNSVDLRIVDSKQITRKVVYSSLTVTPPNSISWSENIGGSTYRGTLYLTSYTRYPSQNCTHAWYTGTVVGNI